MCAPACSQGPPADGFPPVYNNSNEHALQYKARDSTALQQTMSREELAWSAFISRTTGTAANRRKHAQCIDVQLPHATLQPLDSSFSFNALSGKRASLEVPTKPLQRELQRSHQPTSPDRQQAYTANRQQQRDVAMAFAKTVHEISHTSSASPQVHLVHPAGSTGVRMPATRSQSGLVQGHGRSVLPQCSQYRPPSCAAWPAGSAGAVSVTSNSVPARNSCGAVRHGCAPAQDEESENEGLQQPPRRVSADWARERCNTQSTAPRHPMRRHSSDAPASQIHPRTDALRPTHLPTCSIPPALGDALHPSQLPSRRASPPSSPRAGSQMQHKLRVTSARMPHAPERLVAQNPSPHAVHHPAATNQLPPIARDQHVPHSDSQSPIHFAEKVTITAVKPDDGGLDEVGDSSVPVHPHGTSSACWDNVPPQHVKLSLGKRFLASLRKHAHPSA